MKIGLKDCYLNFNPVFHLYYESCILVMLKSFVVKGYMEGSQNIAVRMTVNKFCYFQIKFNIEISLILFRQ